MEIPVNQILTVLFSLLFVVGLFGWFFRCLSNRTSNDYKRSAEEQENLLDVANTPLLDLARLYRGILSGEDVAAVLVAWAEQGFVQLRFLAKKGGQSEISLKKLRDLPVHFPKNEQAIFKCFFNKTEGKTLSLPKNVERIAPEKLAQYENQSVVTKLNTLAGELSSRFSRLFQEIGDAQNRELAQRQSQDTYSSFTFLELFICVASLFMLASGFSFFVDGLPLYSAEFYVYAGLGLLLVGVYFGSLFKLGLEFSPGNFLGYLGIGFLIYLVLVGIQTEYGETGSLFFKNSYRYFGFIFGSLLALLSSSARAITSYGKNLRDFFKDRKRIICEASKEQSQFWRFLPELMLYGCVESTAKKLELTLPSWYEGLAAGQTVFDSSQFISDLDRLGRELLLLALVRR